ncbi:MAG: cytochrome b N-terminal domain-containing protein [Gammaproteobacteria bacterium]|nr:cytochrome b N-terminal domain-containing protein [Gammaproteobacteria bacterium]
MNSTTLKRFFILHYTLAIVLCLLVILHIILLHKVGSSNPLGLELPNDGSSFNKSFSLKDKCIIFIALNSFIYVTCFQPNLLNHSYNYMKADPMVTPSHIVPE